MSVRWRRLVPAAAFALAAVGAADGGRLGSLGGRNVVQRRVTRLSLVALVFPDCACNTNPVFPRALATITRGLRRRAKAAGVDFASVGIALTSDVAEGVEYLVNGGTGTGERVAFDPWDELHTGGSWRNEELLYIVWRDHLAEAAMPQILLIERELDVRESGRIDVIATRRTLQLLGTNAFESWIAGGMLLPDSSVLASQ